MNAHELDLALARWIKRQPGCDDSCYHVQVKLALGVADLAQLAALDLPGWVILDWQVRGLGLSRKQAWPAVGAVLDVAETLQALPAPVLRAHIQVVVAPAADWSAAYTPQSLSPDLLPVLDVGRAHTLNVTAVRARDDWWIDNAHEPPSEEVIVL